MKVAPSVLTANFNELSKELKSIETADLLHLDIMDGHFVPNISFGPHISQYIANATTLPLDVHLMVTNPWQWIDGFSFPNTEYITIHVEAQQVFETIQKIRNNQKKPGISLKPKTGIHEISPYLELVDLVLVMTVEPGFGGQSFLTSALDKVVELVRIRKEKNLQFLIEVDGGVNLDTIELCQQAGVDIVVAGSYLFNQKNRKKGIESLK